MSFSSCLNSCSILVFFRILGMVSVSIGNWRNAFCINCQLYLRSWNNRGKWEMKYYTLFILYQIKVNRVNRSVSFGRDLFSFKWKIIVDICTFNRFCRSSSDISLQRLSLWSSAYLILSIARCIRLLRLTKYAGIWPKSGLRQYSGTSPEPLIFFVCPSRVSTNLK